MSDPTGPSNLVVVVRRPDQNFMSVHLGHHAGAGIEHPDVSGRPDDEWVEHEGRDRHLAVPPAEADHLVVEGEGDRGSNGLPDASRCHNSGGRERAPESMSKWAEVLTQAPPLPSEATPAAKRSSESSWSMSPVARSTHQKPRRASSSEKVATVTQEPPSMRMIWGRRANSASPVSSQRGGTAR